MFSLFRKKEPLLSKEIQDAVVACIAATELHSSGEIRVYVESHCSLVDPVKRCEEVFEQLKMHETKERNGVLLYLALNDRQFAIVGDKNINEKIGGNDYWQHIAVNLQAHFRAGKLKEGICYCITEIGLSLSKFYPQNGDNKNELPDEIVFGK